MKITRLYLPWIAAVGALAMFGCAPVEPVPSDACCDPATEPGLGDNPICIEGATCCADGAWKCNEGDGSSSCTAEAKRVLDGRFVLIEHDGTMMGMPHKGLWLIGHDNFRKLYTASYASSLGTELLSMTGARHPETGAITFYGAMDEPMLKVVGRMVKYVIRPGDKDSWTFEMVDLHAGDDYKVVEVNYTRAS